MNPRGPILPAFRRALFAVLLLQLAACSTAKKWSEMQIGPQPFAEVYDGIEVVASGGGFTASAGECDRGLGVWQSRWRERPLELGHPGRHRLRVEVETADGSAQKGWWVRWYVEQERVKDLRKSMSPTEDDWSKDGQVSELEYLFGQRLARRLNAPPNNSQPKT